MTMPNLPAPSRQGTPPAEYGGESFPGAEHADGLMRRRVMAALLRYRWMILGVTALGTAIGYFLSTRVLPIYRAQASVWIEASAQQGNRGPIRSAQLLDSSGWVELLRSYVVLDEVVRQQRLYLSYGQSGDSVLFSRFQLLERFVPGDYEVRVAEGRYELRNGSVTVERGQVGDSIGRTIGVAWQPAARLLRTERPIQFSIRRPRDAAQALAQQMVPRVDPQGTFLRVSLDGTNPYRITDVLNALIERHVAVAAELKREKLTELTKILQEQLQYAARNLQRAETALESYRVRTITLPQQGAVNQPGVGLAQTQSPVYSSFFDMNVRRDQLRRDREAIEAALADASTSGVSPEALHVIGEVQQSVDLRAALQELVSKQADLRAARYRYSDAHPAVRQRMTEVDSLSKQTIPGLARQLIAQIAAREQELGTRVSTASQELQQIPPRMMEEARLTREKAIAEDLFTTLQARFEEARLAEASSIPDVRVLERAAVPGHPITQNAMRFLLLGLVGGLGLGLAGAVFADRLDPRLRYPQQVTSGMGLTILGAVPHVRKNGKAKGDTQQVIETLRSVRLSVIHAYGSAGPVVVTITSPGSGDGKSFIASNLALCFAENGARTLLIDGDVRRGRLHSLMNVSRKPGLTDYLAGQATREDIMHDTKYASLSLITCGSRRRNGPELLSSPAMAQLLATLRASYDVILVDSAPLGAGVDPFVLGTLSGNMLLVLRTGVTDREYTEAKLDMLDRLPVRMLGAVLNDVRAGDAYGYYSYYSYLPGYEATDEADEREPARQLTGE